ncbi:hypothetical protein BH20VER1_BH20VER1_09450 [soil metagenome]|jgi:hypothetical protein
MADQDKPETKVEDLEPEKDAKGGRFGQNLQGSSNLEGNQNLDRGGSSLDKGGQSLDKGGQSLDRGGQSLD